MENLKDLAVFCTTYMKHFGEVGEGVVGKRAAASATWTPVACTCPSSSVAPGPGSHSPTGISGVRIDHPIPSPSGHLHEPRVDKSSCDLAAALNRGDMFSQVGVDRERLVTLKCLKLLHVLVLQLIFGNRVLKNKNGDHNAKNIERTPAWSSEL